MFGPIDIDSLEFQTRVQILQISEITGVSRYQVVMRAVEELYRRVTAIDEENCRGIPPDEREPDGRPQRT